MSEGNAKHSEETQETMPEQDDESQKIKPWKDKLKKREKEIKHLKKEVEEYKDKYLRTVAEMDNMRKRVEREKSEFYQYSLAEFLKELLVVLDNFERALETESEGSDEAFREGMKAIHRQYLDLLMKKGVKPVEIKDKKFDPNLHQAFMTEESEDVEEPEVGEEFQKGYALHNRLLRPALVKVIIPKKDS